MTQPNIFEQTQQTQSLEQPTQAPVQTQPQVAPQPAVIPDTSGQNVYEDLVKRVTNSDGTQKYATVSDALNALPHAQSHIADQASKIKQLEEELANRQTVEAQLQQMQQQPTEPTAQATPAPTEAEFADMVSNVLAKQKAEETATSNAKIVTDRLTQAYGDKAQEFFTAKAAELGVSPDFLNDLAHKSPEALFRTLGLNGATPNPSTTPPATQSAFMNEVPTIPSQKPLHRMKSSEKVDLWREIRDGVNARHRGQQTY